LFQYGSLPQDKRQYRYTGVEVDESTRQGVLIEKGNRVVIATDYPLNENYSTAESNISRKYEVPGFGSHIVTLSAAQFNKLPIIKVESQKRNEELHFCQFCQEVKYLKNTLAIKSFGRLCCKHIIPFNEKLSIPNIHERCVQAIINIYKTMYTSEDPISSISGTCAFGITKALLHAKLWQKLSEDSWGEYFLDNIVGPPVDEPFFEFLDAKGRVRRGSLFEVDDQLFPFELSRSEVYASWTGNSSATNFVRDTSSDKCSIPYRLLDELKSLNVSDEDLELLRSSHSREDIHRMTSESALTFLASRKSIYGNQSISLARSMGQNATMLGKDVFVKLVYPSLNLLSFTRQLSPHARFDNFMRVVAASWPALSAKAELILYTQKDMKQIVASYESYPVSARTRICPFENLANGDLIEVRSTIDNVGCKLPVEYLTAEFVSASLVGKYTDLGEVYGSWRSARGDGNCYYRAVIFSAIENIIMSENLSLFDELMKRFESLIEPRQVHERSEAMFARASSHDLSIVTLDGSAYLSVENICEIFRRASKGEIWLTVEDFESDILNGSSGIDLALVRCCRQLVSNYLMNHTETEFNGLSLIDAILSSHNDCNDLAEYCEKYVSMMGEDAEGFLVNLGILPLSLGFSIVTVVIDRREDIATNVYLTSSTEHVHERAPTIHL
jgi:hypothetical protein